jgi:hypothetical protein
MVYHSEGDMLAFNAEREIDEGDVELYKYIAEELRDAVKIRDKMISGLQEIIKKQNEQLQLHGIEVKL